MYFSLTHSKIKISTSFFFLLNHKSFIEKKKFYLMKPPSAGFLRGNGSRCASSPRTATPRTRPPWQQGYILYISIIFFPPPHLQDIIFFPRRAGRGEAPAGGGGGVARGGSCPPCEIFWVLTLKDAFLSRF